jgi:hypothetical protein
VDKISGEVTSMIASSDAILMQGKELDHLFNQMLAQRFGTEEEITHNNQTMTNELEKEISPVENDVSDSTGINWKGRIRCF